MGSRSGCGSLFPGRSELGQWTSQYSQCPRPMSTSNLSFLFKMLLKGTTVVFFLLAWSFASSDLSSARNDGASMLTGRALGVRTEVPKFGDGSPIDHVSMLVPTEGTDGVGPEQRIIVTYAGSTENGLWDSVIRSKTPVSNATGRKSWLFPS